MTIAATVIVPIEALTSARDRFQCVPLKCVLPAGSCLIRQSDARKVLNGNQKHRLQLSPCFDCADGRQVKTRIDPFAAVLAAAVPLSPQPTRAEPKKEEPMSTEKSSKCTTPGCNNERGGPMRVPRADLLTLCRKHRTSIQKSEWNYRQRSAKGNVSQPVAAKKPSRKAPIARAKPTDVTMQDFKIISECVLRSLAIIVKLGGIEKAEKLAAALTT